MHRAVGEGHLETDGMCRPKRGARPGAVVLIAAVAGSDADIGQRREAAVNDSVVVPVIDPALVVVAIRFASLCKTEVQGLFAQHNRDGSAVGDAVERSL